MSSSAASIDDLPPEMISELFTCPHPKDLAVCSLVNKRWYSIYDTFKVHRLAASKGDFKKWYDSNQAIRAVERCRPEQFHRLTEKPLLSNLKQLALSNFQFEFDLNKLNRFQQLAHLEIDKTLSKKKVNLSLPKVKVLAFHCRNYCCPLSIDCPLLNTLQYPGEEEDANLLEVKHPETIRILETSISGSKLTSLKNVESLVTTRFDLISKATLLALPRLRELRFNQDIERFFNSSIFELEFPERGRVDRLKQTLNQFIDHAKALNRCDFQFTFSGFRLTKTILDQIDFGIQRRNAQTSSERVYMKNYRLIEPRALPFVCSVDYTELLDGVTGKFPSCFFQKFTDIEAVKATTGVRDADQFLWFLKSLRFLRRLALNVTGLSQEFYDQLPASAHSLDYLVYQESQYWQLNFDFISKFSHLLGLTIYQRLSLKSLASLTRSSGKSIDVSLSFPSKGEYFYIRKCKDSTKWQIYNDECNQLFETENPVEIVNFLEELQKE